MQEHIKIFTGISVLTNRLKTILEIENIPCLVKNEQESGRLGGFGITTNSVHLFVLNAYLEKAIPIVNEFKKEITE